MSSFWLLAKLQVAYTSVPPGFSSRKPLQINCRCNEFKALIFTGSNNFAPTPFQPLRAIFSTCLMEPSCVHSASTNTLSYKTVGSGSTEQGILSFSSSLPSSPTSPLPPPSPRALFGVAGAGWLASAAFGAGARVSGIRRVLPVAVPARFRFLRLRLLLAFGLMRSVILLVQIGPGGGGSLNTVPSARNKRVRMTLYFIIIVLQDAMRDCEMSTPVTLPATICGDDLSLSSEKSWQPVWQESWLFRSCIKSANIHNFAPGAQQISNTCS
mmetsp:Transcript_27917/g.54960  ORF Transcript_27917/g.54960 Transcript_27917/m.54960 type:complete len:269 (+) Transcript_27917:331-1137(+)